MSAGRKFLLYKNENLEICVDPEWDMAFATPNAPVMEKANKLDEMVSALAQAVNPAIKTLYLLKIAINTDEKIMVYYLIDKNIEKIVIKLAKNIFEIPTEIETPLHYEMAKIQAVNSRLSYRLQSHLDKYIKRKLSEIDSKTQAEISTQLSDSDVQIQHCVNALNENFRSFANPEQGYTADMLAMINSLNEKYAELPQKLEFPTAKCQGFANEISILNSNYQISRQTIDDEFTKQYAAAIKTYQQTLFGGIDSAAAKENLNAQLEKMIAAKVTACTNLNSETLSINQSISEKLTNAMKMYAVELISAINEYSEKFTNKVAMLKQSLEENTKQPFLENKAYYIKVDNTITENILLQINACEEILNSFNLGLQKLAEIKENLSHPSIYKIMTETTEYHTSVKQAIYNSTNLIDNYSKIFDEINKQIITLRDEYIPVYQKQLEIFRLLQFILTQNEIFWSSRITIGGGEEVFINGKKYNFPTSVAYMVKALLPADTTTPEDNIKALLAAYDKANTEKSVRDETPIGWIGNTLSWMGSATETNHFYEVIELLKLVADNDLRKLDSLDIVIADIHNFMNTYEKTYHFNQGYNRWTTINML